jgi:HD-GYP domain-containing protein (c-di-GMP phosphodiesterase class II)
LARDLGRNLGLDDGHCEAIYRAALVRDLGKMFLDRSLSYESRRLTPSEWTLVKAHPVEGARVLSRIGGLEDVARIVLHHHEHWDGSGYPAGLRGAAIPIGSRIVGMVDALEALIGGRAYQAPRTVFDALSTVRSLAGSHFDPEVVRCLTDVLEARGVPTAAAVDGTADALIESA